MNVSLLKALGFFWCSDTITSRSYLEEIAETSNIKRNARADSIDTTGHYSKT